MFTIATMKDPEKGSFTKADMKLTREQLEDLRRFNAALQAENEMFEHQALVSQAVPEHLGSVASMAHGHPGRRRQSKVLRPSQKESSQLLGLEQKVFIAQREMEELRNDLEKLRQSSDKETPAKRLCQKNTARHTQKRKLKLKMRQKEEVEKTFHKVDLQKLKIEKRQYIEQIDKLSQDLQQLSVQGGNMLKVFNQNRTKLQSLTLESESLSSDIASREGMLMKLEEQTQQVEKERAKAESKNKKLRTRLSDFHVPDVLSYVEVNALHTKLEQDNRFCERKVAIAEMGLKTLTKAWNKHRATAEAALPPI
uniref:Cilia- and flagella-associated protein 263 n=1 Tax=Astyanax mexicanus TaxID=7994 RepID=W5KQ09_ASTMX